MTQVHPSSVIDESVQLGRNVNIGPNCVIRKGVSIGDGCVLEANVVIGENVTIGKNNRFFANSAIGGKPQILTLGPDDEIGGLTIGDNNVFREQVTVHPSMYKDKCTQIGNDNFWADYQDPFCPEAAQPR